MNPAGGPLKGESPVPGRGVGPAGPLLGEPPTPALDPMAFKKAATPPPLGVDAGEEVAGGGSPPVAPVNDGGDCAPAEFRGRRRTAEMKRRPRVMKVHVGNISTPWLPK